MDTEHYCTKCTKEFASRKELTDHNSIMRRRGKVEGHEVQAKTGQSIAGSQADPKEKKKSNDFFTPGFVSKKTETILDGKDLGMYNSDEEVAGNDGTPDISKNKV